MLLVVNNQLWLYVYVASAFVWGFGIPIIYLYIESMGQNCNQSHKSTEEACHWYHHNWSRQATEPYSMAMASWCQLTSAPISRSQRVFRLPKRHGEDRFPVLNAVISAKSPNCDHFQGCRLRLLKDLCKELGAEAPHCNHCQVWCPAYVKAGKVPVDWKTSKSPPTLHGEAWAKHELWLLFSKLSNTDCKTTLRWHLEPPSTALVVELRYSLGT